MSTTKHTAGTWTAEHDFSGGIAIVSSHRRIHVAHVNKHAGIIDEDTANANLITAAPVLLAALRETRDYLCAMTGGGVPHEEDRPIVAQIDAAITAAEGRR